MTPEVNHADFHIRIFEETALVPIVHYSPPSLTHLRHFESLHILQKETPSRPHMTRTANSAYHSRYSAMAHSTPHITLFFLQASRCIRIAWLLEELEVPYDVRFADRQNQKAPPLFKQESGGGLGKFPCIRDKQSSGEDGDNDIVVHESGAVLEYILDNYDPGHKMMPEARTHAYQRSQIQVFVHAAEGAVLLHALAVLYFRWQMPEAYKSSSEGKKAVEETESKLSVNVHNALAWLERELGSSTGNYLVGNSVTAADVMMHFSVEFTVERELGVKKTEFLEKYPKPEAWLERCSGTEKYKRAVEKTGYTLYPKTT